jgi:hypothetical protein
MKFLPLLRNLVAGLGVAFAAACTPQDHSLLPTPANTLSIAAARSWYEASHPLANPKGATSAQTDTSTSSHWALNWTRAIPLPGPRPLVLVPLQGDAQRFAGRSVQGTRYLVVARDTNSLKPTGLIVELLLNHSTTPVDTAALLAGFYRSYRAAGTPAAPTQGTGLVLFYTDAYRYRTGRRFENGIVQPGAVHLGFRIRKDSTAIGRGGKPAGPTSNYDSVVCTDWYYVNDDGSRGAYIMTTGDCSGPPRSGGTGSGPLGGHGDGGWGGDPGGGGSGDNPDNTGTTVASPTSVTTIVPNALPLCIQSSLTSLQNLSGNDIGGLFQYFADTPYSTWLIQTGNIPNDPQGKQRNALTSQANGMPPDYVVTTLNAAFINSATDIAISRTLIHESLHSYLMVWSYSRGINVNVTTSQLTNAYLQANNPHDVSGQHQAMANIIGQMASALQTRFPAISFEYAQNLFWAGLTETREYAALSAAQKAAITSANTAEVLSQATAQGNKACN